MRTTVKRTRSGTPEGQQRYQVVTSPPRSRKHRQNLPL